ncbi:MAG: hypothetical protein ABS41_07250 [Arenimonas sp. SCN 70-307]|nr:MAG: hypothetical protein ABS41_07250 [Arenimonas sp. SCN 70-307]
MAVSVAPKAPQAFLKLLMGLVLLALAWVAPAAAQTSLTVNVPTTQTFSSTPCQSGTRSYGTATFVPSVTGTYTFNGVSSTGLNGDPYAYIYSGAFNPANGAQGFITCNDDGAGGLLPRLQANLVAGQTYVIMATNWGGGVVAGSVTFNISVVTAPGQPVAPVASVPDLANAATLTVTPPDAGGAPLQIYEVLSSLGGVYTAAASSPINLQDLAGLPGGATVTFQVRARNSAGFGSYSPPSNPVVIRSQTNLSAAPLNATFGDAPQTLAVSSNSPATPALSSNDANVATVSGLDVSFAGVGSTDLVLSQPAVEGFTSASVLVPVTVDPAVPAITWMSPISKTFGDADFVLDVPTSPSAGAFSYSSDNPAVATVSGNTVTIVGAGSATLTVDQAADGNYLAGSTTVSLTVAQAVPAITWMAPISKTFGDADFALDAPTTNSTGAVSYSSDNPAVATVSGNIVTITGAGTATLTVSIAADANYEAASATTTLTVGQATPVISWTAAINKTWGDPAFDLPAPSSPSTGAFSYSSGNTAVATVSGNTVTITGAGTSVITVNQAADTNYTAASATLTLTVGKAAPALTWIGDITKTYGEPAFDLPNPTSPSPGAYTFASSNTAVATISGRTVTITGDGVSTLTVTQAETANYQSATASVQLLVNARPDPRDDPGVVAGLQAQVDASVRFASAQQMNIRDRLRQVRSGSNGNSNGLALNLNPGFGPGLGLSAGQAGDASAMALPEGWGWWTAGAITFGDRNPGAASSEFGFHTDGISLGVDRKVGDNAVLGVAFGLGWNDTEFDGNSSSLSGEQRALSVYGLWRGSKWFVDGLLGYGEIDFDIRRYSALANANATANRGGDQVFGSATLGYEHAADGNRLVGYARVDASRSKLDAYRETGLGIYDLSYTSQTVDNSTVSLGLEGGSQWFTSSGVMRPYWMVEYRLAVDNRSDVGINYVVLPNATDYVLGMRSYADDAFVWGGGLDMDISGRWGLSLLYRGERLREGGDSYGVGLMLNYRGSAPAAAVQSGEASAQGAGTTTTKR